MFVHTDTIIKQIVAEALKSIDCIRLCNHKYAIFSFNPVMRHSMTHTNKKHIRKFAVLLEQRCSILSIMRT